jgi:quercetin dioxygenase-like cupin family protein
MSRSEPVILRAADAKTEEFDWGRLDWFASAELGNSGHQTVGCCTLRPGMENPCHSHPNCEEVLHVLRGRISHYMEGAEDEEMSEGDTITLPAGVPHRARNAGDEDAVLLICYSSADRRIEKQGEIEK